MPTDHEHSPEQTGASLAPKWMRARLLAFPLLVMTCVLGRPTFAETRWTLEQLKVKALGASPAIREAQAELGSAIGETGKSRARFFPEVGVEGGWEGYQASAEKKKTSFGFLFARYNLFNGGRDRAHLLSRSREESLAEIQVDQSRRALSRSVEGLFYELLYFQSAVSLQKDAQRLNETHLVMAKKKQQSGLTSKSDVLEFTLRGQSLESDLALLLQERAAALKQLGALLGGIETVDWIVDGSFREASKALPSTEVLLTVAEESRPGLARAKADLDVREYALRAAYGGFLPRMDLEADYGRVPFDRREFERASQAAAIVKITWPLFSGFESLSERKHASAEEERASARLMRERLEARAEIESLIVKYSSIMRRLELAKATLTHAKSYFEATVAEYRRGVKNSPDLAGATERHFESQLKEIALKKDLSLTALALEKAVGGLP